MAESKDRILNEFETAITYGFSPELLRWFTENPVIGEDKLPFEEKHGVYFYRTKDVEKFNAKLSGSWPLPKSGKKRPHIPDMIRNEIKSEAFFQCPACHAHQGEIAHICRKRPIDC